MMKHDYYLVVDLEATCDDLGSVPRHESETIEIGAVLVDGASLSPIAEQMIFVRPTLHPITPFCTRLTTITPEMVEDALRFPAAIARLASFGAGALFCSWGAYDKNQLAADARRCGVEMPFREHWNLKEAYAARAGTRRGLGNQSVLRRLGITPEGTHHRGIDDARNIAKLLPYVLGRDQAAARSVTTSGYPTRDHSSVPPSRL